MLKENIGNYQLSDEDLIVKYKSTMDSYYVGVLFERYMDIIFGISLKYLKNRHDAEDMMSTVFEKLLEVLKVKEVDLFKHWLFVLVKNQCVSKLRSAQTEHQRQQRYVDYVSHLKIGEDFAGAVDYDQLKEKEKSEEGVRAIMDSLPEKQRKCIEYFYFENRTYKEIAGLLNEAEGKVRSHIQNGRRNLKLMMVKGN